MKSVLLNFKDSQTRDKFVKAMHSIANLLIDNPNTEQKENGAIIKEAIDSVQYDPSIRSDEERLAGVFVSGQKMAEGNLQAMRIRFQQEIDSHSAGVELKEKRNGEWKPIQTRRKQGR